ncbi:2-dehydro-3-deoxygalactonokinase [Sphingomonas sp. BT-65]|uniref:2-dehydro-3-deoxygalactonokinase n=1 Tax=Sphingomonas sp. BT-65 TaxID=2989821 RepID=UPI0022354B90|nr:2-dehydro-3-deoxygalactonokinase [Sphingomonas sp. BT-65]MCW4461191.1 2-dehydro-3-deoxygalactonokinase [Sphingomonas sp. BT-65]
MAAAGRFIAGDWGSSFMRLYLCETGAPARILETASGLGIKFCDNPEAAFFDVAGAWIDRDGPLPVVLAGMVGSNIGWVDCPYAPCPAGLDDLAARMTRFEVRGVPVAIVPGLSCTNIFGLPDVMRGEEAQVFGWLAQAGAGGRRTLCLPGTHAKWCSVTDARVTRFFTSMTGEMFEILVAHSLVGRDMTPGTAIEAGDPAFVRGVEIAVSDPRLAVEHAIFSARSLRVTGSLSPQAARPYLSGLLIGCEIRDALAALAAAGEPVDHVTLIGAPALSLLYAAVLDRLGVVHAMADVHAASLAGLAALAGHTQPVSA